jgi:alpha-1,2-mannosyltransferase
MGYAFTYPLVKLVGNCKVVSYTHYPIVRKDMIVKVDPSTYGPYHQDPIVAKPWFWIAKLYYNRVFALLYRWVGMCADIVMVNSSWTCDQIESLWKRSCQIVYPPCDTTRMNALSLDHRQRIIISVGQFRPEKDHSLQLRSLARLFELDPNLKTGTEKVKLVLLGGTRHEADDARVVALRELAKQLQLEVSIFLYSYIVTHMLFRIMLNL